MTTRLVLIFGWMGAFAVPAWAIAPQGIVSQTTYAKASNSGVGDLFGTEVAISGDWMVVGAACEASGATGVDGDQMDNSQPDSGAAYVFERVAGNWQQRAYLKASNAQAGDRFGAAVSIAGELVVVGAPGENSQAVGVNGNQADNSMDDAGAVYVFARSAGIWSQQAYLKASNADAGDFFGSSVSIAGDQVVVGAPWEGSQATGVGGNQSDNSLFRAGAAYVFERNAGTWSQRAYLKASNTDALDRFGIPVAISGDLIVVGAIEEASAATGVNGNASDNSLVLAGAAYVFEKAGGVWAQGAYLKASNTESADFFGFPVAISDELVVVGAHGERSGATGVNGDQSDNSLARAGAAYVFGRAGGTWVQEAYLKATNTGLNDNFGFAVAISGQRIAVGAPGELSSAIGVDGNTGDNSLPLAGAAYLFERSSGVWSPLTYLKASNTGAGDLFGNSLALSQDQLIVAAPGEDSDYQGLGGTGADDSASDSGAVYVFDLDVPSASFCGPAVANSSSISANLTLSGSLVVANNALQLHAEQLPANVFGYFLSAPQRDFVGNVVGSQGALCLGGPIGRHHVSLQNSGSAGGMDYAPDLTQLPTPTGPISVQAGETWNFQCWFRDNNPSSTSNFSSGLSVRFE